MAAFVVEKGSTITLEYVAVSVLFSTLRGGLINAYTGSALDDNVQTYDGIV